MNQLAQINESYSLSVNELTAYVISNCANRDFSEKTVIATGFEYFNPEEDREIFLAYPLEDVVSTKIKITKLDESQPCDICSSNVDRPIADIYVSEDNFQTFLDTHSEFRELPHYRRTQLVNICEDCQSAVVTDLYEELPAHHKLARNL